jgi:hypothetical protein
MDPHPNVESWGCSLEGAWAAACIEYDGKVANIIESDEELYIAVTNVRQ